MPPETFRLADKLQTVLGRRVSVETSDGRIHIGDLVSIDDNLNLILENLDNNLEGLILNGTFVREIRMLKAFDLRGFLRKLEEVFPGLVRMVDDEVIVMDKIKVTERGVEGRGLAADRIRTLYDQFVKEKE